MDEGVQIRSCNLRTGLCGGKRLIFAVELAPLTYRIEGGKAKIEDTEGRDGSGFRGAGCKVRWNVQGSRFKVRRQFTVHGSRFDGEP
jgi:hypothetical protein